MYMIEWWRKEIFYLDNNKSYLGRKWKVISSYVLWSN